MRVLLVVCCVAVLLSGCISLDGALSQFGVVRVSTSPMDGEKSVSTTPAFAKKGYAGGLMLGLAWRAGMGDRAHLLVQVPGAINFSRGDTFDFVVDGKKYQLPPVTSTVGDVEYDSMLQKNNSIKSFWITKDQLVALVNGKQGAYRLIYLNDKYSEGELDYCCQGYPSYFHDALKRAAAVIWGGAPAQ